MKHDKDVAPDRAEQIFKSIIRSGFYPRKVDKAINFCDRDKPVIKLVDNVNKVSRNVFEESSKQDVVPLKTDVYKGHLKSSIEFNFSNIDDNNYKRKKEYASTGTDYNDLCYKDIPAKKSHNIIEHNSHIPTHVKNKTTSFNPIVNPQSETNVFKLNCNKKSNKTFVTSNSNIFYSKTKTENNQDPGFKQFSMGKITTQPISIVTEKSKNTVPLKPITSFGHYKDTVTGQTYYRS